MEKSLGIVVVTRDAFGHLIGVVTAAKKKGLEAVVFFTGDGVWVTQEPRFGELAGQACMSVCEVSFRKFNLHLRGEVPGLGFKDYVTQHKLGEMLSEHSHILVL